MKNYITIDGGTTNTRISRVVDGKPCGTVRLSIGARLGADRAKEFKCALAGAVRSLSDCDTIKIIASGMITSESGIYNLRHIPSPAGKKELHDGMREAFFPEISDIPFVFIPGVKQSGESCISADMMRGEETEIFGLSDDVQCDCLYILPGSHSKLIEIDNCGRISRFSTFMTGEMIGALSENTILKTAVDLCNSKINEKYLLEGYYASEQLGIGAALFKTRILKNMFSENRDCVYSFFTGAVMNSEINAVVKSGFEKVIIGGRAQLKEAETLLLRKLSKAEIISVPDETAAAAPAVGAVGIYEFGGGKA